MSGVAFFNLDAKASTSGRAVEGEHYVLIEDGNRTKHRVFNFDNPEICKRTGIIELVPMKRTSRHENWLNITTVYDRINDIIIGIPLMIDNETKQIKYQRITIREDEIFDLTNPVDAKKWAVIKHHPLVEGSPFTKGNKPKYKVYDKEKEADEFLVKRTIKRKAESIAEGLYGAELRDAALSLGVTVENVSASVMSMKVIQFAEQNSKLFMEYWDHPSRYQVNVFKKALSLGVIKHDPLLGIFYNGLSLGSAEPQAIQFLKDNIQTCNIIQSLVEAKDADSFISMQPMESPIVDEKDAENQRLKAELAQLKRQIQETSAVKLDELADKTAEKMIVRDEEFEELLVKAKSFKPQIQGAHLIKDKEILRQKIVDREKQENN